MKKKNILIIDDDPAICEVIQEAIQTLRPGSYSIRANYDTAEGLLTFTQERPDLLLLDWKMAPLNGMQFMRMLDGLHVRGETHILVLSASADLLLRQEDISGIDTIMGKPFDIDVLLEEIEKLLVEKRPNGELVA